MERTVCETHWTTDSSQTHGTQHAYEDSTPSAGLSVRLLPLSPFYFYFYFFTLAVRDFVPSPYLLSPKPIGACMCIVRTYLTRHPRSSYLGASLSEVYINGPHAQNMCDTSA